jgi:hypothetical protein
VWTTTIRPENHELCFARVVIAVSVYLQMTRTDSKQPHDIFGNTKASPAATVTSAVKAT